MRKSILIFLFTLLGVLSAQAYDFMVDGIYYNRISGTDQVEVTKRYYLTDKEYSGSVVIPATVEYEGTSYRVTSIGEGVFEKCRSLTSVTIPESVTSIGNSAFSGCSGLTSVEWNAIACQDFKPSYTRDLLFYDCENITSITFGNQVKHIPAYLCYGMNKLTSVTIPESVTSIGVGAFSGCGGLTSVTMGQSVDTIGSSAFYNCTGLTSVTIPESVTYIGSSAFYSCTGLTSVTIQEGVTSIGGYAFYGCTGLTSVTIPESVTSIGDESFGSCSGLTSVEWNANLIGHNDVYNSFKGKPSMPFSDCGNITAITFGNQVTHIPAYLCYYLSSLTSVTMGQSVTYIGSSAFSDCRGLTSITIPESVDTIGSSSFSGCSGLTSMTLPENVISIGSYAFSGCTGLTTVTIPESVTYIGSSAFSGCTGLTSVDWNAIDCRDFTSSPFPNLTSVTFGNEVEHLPSYLCYGMNKLTSVAIPNSVTSIGASAFSSCSGLTSVTIGERVDSIGFSAFSGCSSLTSVTIPNSVTYIGPSAFSDCSGLTSVTIHATSIGASAFFNCKGIRAVTLSASITSIGSNVFGNCDGLISVTSLAKLPPYCEEENVFGSTSEYYQMLYVPRGSKSAYASAKEWHKFSKIEEIETHTVTVQPNDAVMGRVTGGGEYQEGEQAILTAIPNSGYHFVKWNDGNTDNPRTMKVIADITLTAIFEKIPEDPTANEAPEADNFRVYVQDRTIYLSEDRGVVQVYNMAGQCVYNGHATAIPVQRAGVYVVVANDKRIKVMVK